MPIERLLNALSKSELIENKNSFDDERLRKVRKDFNDKRLKKIREDFNELKNGFLKLQTEKKRDEKKSL